MVEKSTEMKYEEKEILVDDKKISYLDVGEGPVILYIHGLYSVKESFWGVMAYLPNFRVIAIDLPGSGNSEYDYDCNSVIDFASKIFRFTNQLGVKPFMMVGSSLGCTIILELAKSGLVSSGTILLQAPVIEGKQIKFVYRNPIAKLILHLSLRSTKVQKYLEKGIQWKYKKMIIPLESKTEHLKLSQFVYDRSIKTNWETYVNSLRSVQVCNYSTTLANIAAPLTILQPDEDSLVNSYYKSENFRVRKMEGGHSIMRSNWEDTAQEIKNMINDVKAQLRV